MEVYQFTFCIIMMYIIYLFPCIWLQIIFYEVSLLPEHVCGFEMDKWIVIASEIK